MPFITREVNVAGEAVEIAKGPPSDIRPNINPPPRQRSTAAVPTSAAQPSRLQDKVKVRSNEKKRPTGDYPQGYCRPPIHSQFKQGNPGGPGRPKGRKSQDTLLREELESKQTVRIEGRERQISKRALVATLLVNTGLEKRDLKHLVTLHSESKRLFPEAVAAERPAEIYDPAADRRVLEQLLEHLAFGEADPENVDPLADLATIGLELGKADNTAWSEGEWTSDAVSLTDDD